MGLPFPKSECNNMIIGPHLPEIFAYYRFSKNHQIFPKSPIFPYKSPIFPINSPIKKSPDLLTFFFSKLDIPSEKNPLGVLNIYIYIYIYIYILRHPGQARLKAFKHAGPSPLKGQISSHRTQKVRFQRKKAFKRHSG